MSAISTVSTDSTFDQALTSVEKLSPTEQFKLVMQLIPKISWFFERIDFRILSKANIAERQVSQQHPLKGVLAHLGPGPSAEDIGEVRREMWSTLGEQI